MSRFIAPDTIVPDPYNPQSLNRYTYCLNNPLTYIDPSGHSAEDAYMAILQYISSLYGVWPQMGLIMQHDYLMGFNSFQTGFEMTAVDPDTVILASLLAGTQSSGGGGKQVAEGEKVTLTVGGKPNGNHALTWAYPDGNQNEFYYAPLYDLNLKTAVAKGDKLSKML